MSMFDADFPNLPRAACRDLEDPDSFFPKWDTGRPSKHAQQVALLEVKGLCDVCPERLKCLRWALDHGEEGIWGGTTEEQRRLIQKKPLTQEQRRRRVRQFHKEGLTDGAIADKVGVSRSVVQNDRGSLGLADNFRTQQERIVAERRAKVAELHEAGLNDIEIARKVGSDRFAVRRDRLALDLRQNHRTEREVTA